MLLRSSEAHVTTFLLVRHGLTDDVGRAVSGRASGIHLNVEGRTQAVRTAAQLEGVRVDAVISSPLERAKETAAPIAAVRGIDIQTLEAFHEFDFGEWTGRTLDQLSTDEQWQRFNSARSVTKPPSGELMLQVQQRAIAGLLDLATRFPAGNVVVVSHGDVIRAVLLYALGTPIDFVHRIEISPARISIVQLDSGGFRVLQVNGDTATALPDR